MTEDQGHVNPASTSATGRPRVAVIGVPGAGKTWLARRLATELGVQHVEVDELFWRSGWEPRHEAALLADLDKLPGDDGWVIDGQYPFTFRWIGKWADAVIWVDPAFLLVMPSLIRRTVLRLVLRQPIFGGNRETIWSAFGPSSVVWYAIRSRRSARRSNHSLMESTKSTGIATRLHRRPDEHTVQVLSQQLRKLSVGNGPT